MAVSYTYGDMQNKVADELGGRTDLLTNQTGLSSSPIQMAIQTAIRKWERERFYFNEIRTTGAFTTVLNQEFYTASDAAFIGTLAHIDKMSITMNSANRYWMIARTAEYMEDISVSLTDNGMPVDFCYYGEQIRLYPIPDNAYPVNVLYTKRVAELVSTGDTNIWTNDAEELIRLTAKMILYSDTLMDDVGAQRMLGLIYGVPGRTGALYALKAETARRVATSRMRPTYF